MCKIFILQLLTHPHKEHSTHVFPLSFLSPSPSCARSENPNKQVNDLHQPSCIFESRNQWTRKINLGSKTRAQQEAVCDQKGFGQFSGDRRFSPEIAKGTTTRTAGISCTWKGFLLSSHWSKIHIRCKFPHASLVVFSRKGCA